MKRCWRQQRGVTALEFALILPFLFILTFGAIDIGMETMLDAALERGAEAAARIGVTVQTTAGETSSQAVYQAVWQPVSFWLSSQSQLTVSSYTYTSYAQLESGEPCLTSGYTGTCTGTSGTGGYGSIVRYQFNISRPTFTGILKLLNIQLYSLQRTVIVQNESLTAP